MNIQGHWERQLLSSLDVCLDELARVDHREPLLPGKVDVESNLEFLY